MKQSLLFILLCLSCVLTFAADDNTIKAEVNRQSLQVGDTLQLTVTASGHNLSDKPDFSILEKDFSILFSGTKTQLMIVNGKSQSNTSWQFALSPKHDGDIPIPVFKLGAQTTQPIIIHVSNAASAPSSLTDNTAQNKGIFLQAEVSPSKVYVQSQAVYTLKLFYNQTVQNAQFSDPQVFDANIFRVGDDIQYEQTFNGNPYEVLERHYAIIPHKTGTLTISPPTFSGNVLKQEHFGDPNSAFITTQWRPMSTQASALTLEVQPIPASAQSGWWLPTEQLTLKEQWPVDVPSFKVGQPITRTIIMEAQGTTGEALPDISQQTIQGAQVYADKPVISTTMNGKILAGKREQKMALIPQKSGTLILPAIKVNWWNTKTEKMETATIPERTITVSGESTTQPAPTMPVTQTDKVDANDAAPTASNEYKKSSAKIWIAIALLFFLLWVVTLIAWMNGKRKKISAQPSIEPYIGMSAETIATLGQLRDKIHTGCMANNAEAVKNTVIQWAALKWPDLNIRNLGDVEKYVLSDKCRALLKELDQHLYANGNVSWDGKIFWEAIELEFTQVDLKKNAKTMDLPKLYPDVE